jgi:diguanylate cyclase (GGDEF)-like protein
MKAPLLGDGMKRFRKRAGGQALVIAAVGGIVWAVSVENNAFETLVGFLERDDRFQFDEILLTVTIVGLMSLFYSALRVWDLRQEIVRRMIAEQNMQWISTHDEMTALQNQRSLNDRTNVSGYRDKSPLSVFAIELHGVKDINDLMGHHVGHEVLKQIAERLKENFSYDDIFRTSGSQFVALLDLNANLDVDIAAHRILSSVNLPMQIDGQSVEIGMHIGYALFPQAGSTVAEVVRCAEVARDAAKTDPFTDIRAFESVMHERLQERSELERQLRHAIRVDAITPYYQPIIDLKTGKINGFEALARWEITPGKFVPPMRFIELAEQTGMIAELTGQLFRKACADARDWPEDVILSFNLSPTQLHDGLLGIRILSVLSEVGLSPPRLEIEITESALVHDLVAAERILTDLRNARIRISLDDFGTGYSSLGQLSKFSFDKIKIDRSFVSAIGDCQKNENILKAIIGLSKGLDILTTAEGIETEEQRQQLTGMGANNGQGYLFGKAMPAREAAQFLHQCWRYRGWSANVGLNGEAQA